MANPRISGTDNVIAHCRQLLNRKKTELAITIPYTFVTTISNQNGIQRVDAPDEMKPIIDFACQPEIVRIVAAYMREIPVLSTVSLIYTPINDRKVGPQNFHRDMNCAKQLHLILNIEDVDADSGPFTFIPGAETSAIIKKVNHKSGRIGDSDVLAHVSDDDLIRCVGKSGTTFFVNPYACFHYGARCSGKPRYILILNYTSKFEWGEGLASVYRSSNRQLFDDGTMLRRQLLGLA